MELYFYLTDPPWLDRMLDGKSIDFGAAFFRLPRSQVHTVSPALRCAQHIFIEKVMILPSLKASQWRLLIHFLPRHHEERWTLSLLLTAASRHHSSSLINTNKTPITATLLSSLWHHNHSPSSTAFLRQVLPHLTWTLISPGSDSSLW